LIVINPLLLINNAGVAVVPSGFGMKSFAWLILLATLPFQSSAQWQGWDYEFDQEKKAWTEIQAKIPGYPKSENLRKFYVDETTPHSFFIDTASLSVGEDGVVRYTLMVRTGGGAINVSFEGIRCEAREFKVYALGRPYRPSGKSGASGNLGSTGSTGSTGSAGYWSRARDSQWRYIERPEINAHHYVLQSQYFCVNKRVPATLQQINHNLIYGPPDESQSN
jgi:hypothetical protein